METACPGGLLASGCKKSRDKSLTTCYVLSSWVLRHARVIFLSFRHFMLISKVIRQAVNHWTQKEFTMDDYQEELLEYQAFELDPLDPAEDATEL